MSWPRRCRGSCPRAERPAPDVPVSASCGSGVTTRPPSRSGRTRRGSRLSSASTGTVHAVGDRAYAQLDQDRAATQRPGGLGWQHRRMLIQPGLPADREDLAALLVDAVESGACVGFLDGITFGDALAFWTSVEGAATWVARLQPNSRAVGAVQLHLPKLPNGGHRAEVAKLLVHRSARGRGVANTLMAELERQAQLEGRWLLQLDTETGSAAERLYMRLGWQVLGVIPDHAVRPNGDLVPTTFMFKRLLRHG